MPRSARNRGSSGGLFDIRIAFASSRQSLRAALCAADSGSAPIRSSISRLKKGGENFVGQNKAKLAVGPGRVPKCPGPEMSYARSQIAKSKPNFGGQGKVGGISGTGVVAHAFAQNEPNWLNCIRSRAGYDAMELLLFIPPGALGANVCPASACL